MTGLRTIVPKYVFLVLIALGWAFGAVAEPLFQFHTLTKKDGLSSSVIYDITQGNDGFMWFGTEDGLQKYDGFELVTYRQNRRDPNSISNNLVRKLMFDKVGTLWIGTDNGLNIFQKNTENFKRITFDNSKAGFSGANRIRALYQTSDGIIWVGSSAGLAAIDPTDYSVEFFQSKTVRAIFEDDRKQLWIGTLSGGLYLFNRISKEFVPVKYKEDNQIRKEIDVSQISIVDIYQDSFGRVFVATWGQGVFILNREVRRLNKYFESLPSKFVRKIHQDNKGQIWFATKEGIQVLEPVQKTSKIIQAFERNKASLVSDNVTSIFQSDDDTIWVGTYGGGVSRHFPASRRFESYGLHPKPEHGLVNPVVYSLSENQKGDIWIGTEDGTLSVFNPETKTFKHFKLRLDGEDFNIGIISLLEAAENNILVGTTYGLYSFDKFENSLVKVIDPNDPFISAEQTVNFISKDRSERIWFGIRNKGAQAYRLDKDRKLVAIPGTYLELKDPVAIDHSSPNFVLLAAANIGLLKVEFSEDHLKNLTFKVDKFKNTANLNIYRISQDWKGRVWLATTSEGIKILNEKGNIVHLDESSGFPINSVYTIVPDIHSQKLWASTNKGLVSISPDSLKVSHYTTVDGLQSDEYNSPALLSKNGYLYFGGTDGLDRFYPNVIERDLVVRPPKLVDFRIANKTIAISEQSILTKSLSATQKINLAYNQTPFSFKFTSPQFLKPEVLEFRYRLRGVQNNWITALPVSRQATYTNIGAGEYLFELQVRQLDGKWISAARSMNILISPPWWLTGTAKFFYMLTMVLILSLMLRLYWRKRQKELRIQASIKENEERLKLSLWGSGYEFWDWNIETSDISRSKEFKKIQIDCPKLSRNLTELASYVHPNDLEMVREKLSNHIAGNSKYFDICYRVIDASSGWRWIQDRGKVVALDSEGNALRMSGTQRDITDIRERDEQFEMLGQAFKSTSDGVWIRDHEWRLVECNPAYERITGFSLGEKKGETLWFPEIQEQPENLIQRIRISIEEKGNWQGEAWAERKNNDAFPQKLSIDTLHDEKGNIRYYVGVFSDITFHKRTEEEFRKLANYDSLTGLPNRACLYDRLNQTIEKTKRDNGRFALFLIDIDNFKRINDSLGHNVGDQLIRQVASRLVNCNKEGDTVARIGGDEFVIVMENVKSSSSVATFSQLLLKELNQPIFVRGQKLKLNFSIGVTLAPDDAIVGERLIRNADTAMYEAKKSIENSYRFYAVEFNERARKRLALETALRKAIDDEAIELFYQPKIDLNTGSVDGLEALARWTHKELGFISPGDFIPLAEETGLIVPLGKQLLRDAIRQTKSWVEQGIMKGRTSVNLSAHQFWNRNFAAEASEILREESLDAKFIELEITESACMQDIEETKSQIKILKDLGFRLALDDFGTGYSSLAQLKMLPFDTIKVDKSFVDNIETDTQDAKVVKAIIDIAKTMEMDVVIEGVESKSQCEYLWMHRAFMVQGFYFSRPVRSNLIPEILSRKWHKQEYLSKLTSNVTPLA